MANDLQHERRAPGAALRLLRRATGPLGAIDVGRPQNWFEEAHGWAAHHTPVLDPIMARLRGEADADVGGARPLPGAEAWGFESAGVAPEPVPAWSPPGGPLPSAPHARAGAIPRPPGELRRREAEHRTAIAAAAAPVAAAGPSTMVLRLARRSTGRPGAAAAGSARRPDGIVAQGGVGREPGPEALQPGARPETDADARFDGVMRAQQVSGAPEDSGYEVAGVAPVVRRRAEASAGSPRSRERAAAGRAPASADEGATARATARGPGSDGAGPPSPLLAPRGVVESTRSGATAPASDHAVRAPHPGSSPESSTAPGAAPTEATATRGGGTDDGPEVPARTFARATEPRSPAPIAMVWRDAAPRRGGRDPDARAGPAPGVPPPPHDRAHTAPPLPVLFRAGAGGSPAHEPPPPSSGSSPAVAASSAPPSEAPGVDRGAASPGREDLEDLAERVARLIARRLEIERERRGGRRWP